MRCPVCNGVGMVDNPRYYKHPNWYNYDNEIPSTIRCRHCDSYGFIIGKISDIIPALQTTVDEKRGLTAKETKQILTTLLKEENKS